MKKTRIMADIKEDTLLQTDLSRVMEHLRGKRRRCDQKVEAIQASGRNVSKHEEHYSSFLQGEINNFKSVVDDVLRPVTRWVTSALGPNRTMIIAGKAKAHGKLNAHNMTSGG